MGQCKLLLPLPDRPVIVRCLETVAAAGVCETIVVLAPPHGTAIHEVIARFPVTVAWNCRPDSDMAGSLRVGLEHLSGDVTGVLVFLPDTPLVHPATCHMLMDEHAADPRRIYVPVHAGRRGHPVLFPRFLIEELPDYPTLRDLMQMHQHRIVLCPIEDAGILHDLDTPADYLQAKTLC